MFHSFVHVGVCAYMMVMIAGCGCIAYAQLCGIRSWAGEHYSAEDGVISVPKIWPVRWCHTDCHATQWHGHCAGDIYNLSRPVSDALSFDVLCFCHCSGRGWGIYFMSSICAWFCLWCF